MSTSDAAGDLVRWLAQRVDCRFEAGLSSAELAQAEREFAVRFPPVWRRVLAEVLPLQLPEPARDPDGVRRWTRFPDWRGRDRNGTESLVQAPTSGILFDVKQGFWWRDWGAPPTRLQGRLDIASARLGEVPRLVPLWDHWFVAASDASPVFSIVQTDVSVVGASIAALPDGAGPGETAIPPGGYPVGDVPFWSLLHAWSQLGHASRFGDLAVTLHR